MSALPDGADVLIALLRGDPGAHEPLDDAAWQQVLDLSARQRATPLLYQRLRDSGITSPPAVSQALRHAYLATFARNARMLHDAGHVCAALDAAGIPVLALKGACLAVAVYDDPALRPMTDLDLMVRPGDLAAAVAIAESLFGAEKRVDVARERQESHDMPPMPLPGGGWLELHWTILDPRRGIGVQGEGLDGLWARAVPQAIGGEPALMPSPADLLLHLGLHISVHHGFDSVGLREFWDMALVIRRYGAALDWGEFARGVAWWQAANGMALALELMEEWTGVAVPAGLKESLGAERPDPATREWALFKIWNEPAPGLEGTSVASLGKARWRDRLPALARIAFPSRREMAYRYHLPDGSPRVWLYYPVRLWDLLRRYGGTGRRWLAGDRGLGEELRREARLRDFLGWR